MSRIQALFWSIMASLLGGSLLIYLILWVSPYLSHNQLNIPALLLFLIALLIFSGGVGTYVALMLHRRWPALSGSPRRNPAPIIAIRQGFLIACAITIVAILMLLRLRDTTFVIMIFLIFGLAEAFFQTRQRI